MHAIEHSGTDADASSDTLVQANANDRNSVPFEPWNAS